MVVDFVVSVSVCFCSLGSVVLRLLLGDTGSVLSVDALVDAEIELFEDDAVCWDSVALLDTEDVTDDEFTNGDRGGCSEGSSEDGYLLIVNLVLDFEVLLLLDVVAEGSEEAGKHEAEIDGEGFDVALAALVSSTGRAEEREDEVDGGDPGHVNDVGVLELSVENGAEALDLRQSDSVAAECDASALDVSFVADDSGFGVGSEEATETLVVLALAEHVERVSALALVGRLAVLGGVEELAEVLPLDSEDLVARNSLMVSSKLLQVGRSEVGEQVSVQRPKRHWRSGRCHMIN